MSADSVLSMGAMRRCCDHLLAAAIHARCPTVRFEVSPAAEDRIFSNGGLLVMAGATVKVGRNP
jgi:hypothetical protein